MKLNLSTKTRRADLSNVHDFSTFQIVLVDAATAAELASAFPDALSRADEADHLWVQIDAVLRWAAPTNEEWATEFTSMLVKVERFGWYDRSGDRIKAHITTQ